MGLRLIPNWRTVLTRAYSVWMIGLALLVETAASILPLLEMDVPDSTIRRLSIACLIAGLCLRFVAQDGITKEKTDVET